MENKIYEIFDHMSLEEKEIVVAKLQRKLKRAQKAPKKTYLGKQWSEIQNLIYRLSRYKYIDDQFEIDIIWNIVPQVCKYSRLKDESWVLRKGIVQNILSNDYYHCYGVYDPMRDLVRGLIFDNEEGLQIADSLAAGDKEQQLAAAEFYKKYGKEERYYEISEQFLGKDTAGYLELIEYYKSLDTDKAIELAEKARKKCNDPKLTEIYVFLMQEYSRRGETEAMAQLIRSAKARRMVNTQAVLDAQNGN